jgi:hypothetical protein
MELPDNLDFNCIFADHDQRRSETIEKTPPPTPVTLPTFAALPLSENPLRICSFEHEGSAVSYSLISKQRLFRALSRMRAWKHTAAKPRLRPASAKLWHGDITKRANEKGAEHHALRL